MCSNGDGCSETECRVSDVGNSDCDTVEEIVEAVPGGVFEIKNDTLTAKDSLYKYDLAGVAEKVSHGKVRIKNTGDFVFHMESFGQLSCKEILKVSMDVLDEQLDEIAELAKKLE